jgi:RAB protein geranylgeranyltransferase component A
MDDDELQSTVFDAIILGTGISESFVAAYVVMHVLYRYFACTDLWS